MQKLLSIFIYLLMLIFIESAAEVTGVPASAPAEISAEPKYVALTFDDGPRRDTTARLLDGLRQRGASATFFLVGERLAGNEDLVLRMQREGHQIGNHTYSHIRLDGSDAAGQLADIEEAQPGHLRHFRHGKLLAAPTVWPCGADGTGRNHGAYGALVRRSTGLGKPQYGQGGTGRAGGGAARRYHSAARYLLHLCRCGASDRGHAGRAGVLACYGGGAADPWRNSTAGRVLYRSAGK